MKIIKNLNKTPNQEKQNLINLLSYCNNASEENSFTATANAYFILGYLKALLCSKIPLIDPVLKVALKKKYSLEEISDVETLKANYELLNLVHSDTPKTVHAYCVLLSKRIDELRGKVEKYEEYVAVRPVDVSYKSLASVITFAFFIFSVDLFVCVFFRLLITLFQRYFW